MKSDEWIDGTLLHILQRQIVSPGEFAQLAGGNMTAG